MKGNQSQNLYLKRLLFIVLAILFLSLIIILFLFILFTLFPLSSVSFSSHPHKYKLTRINPSKNTTSFGIAQIPLKLEQQNEYIFFSNPQMGESVFIQNFGGHSYSCSGSCYCNSNDERRIVGSGSTSVLTRGVFIFLSAFSAFFAYQMAEDSIREHCHQEFGNICDEEDIDVVVESCSHNHNNDRYLEERLQNFDDRLRRLEGIVERLGNIFRGGQMVEDNPFEQNFGASTSTSNPAFENFSFRCSGHCSRNEDHNKRESDDPEDKNTPEELEKIAKWIEKNGPCEDLRVEDDRIMLADIDHPFQLPNRKELLTDEMMEDLIKEAEKQYMFIDLDIFCQKMSRMPDEVYSSACISPLAIWESGTHSELRKHVRCVPSN